MEFEVHIIGMETCKNATFPLPMTLKNLDRSSEYWILTDIKNGEVSKLAKFSEFATIRVHELEIEGNDSISPVPMLMLAAMESVVKSINKLPNSEIRRAIFTVGDRCFADDDNKFKGYFGLILQY